jgi:hypothetical protein
MQELLANGNYAPFLAQALTPPLFGGTGMMGAYGPHQGIGQQFGNPGLGNQAFGNPAFGQFGQGQFGLGNGGLSLAGQQGFGQQLGQPHQIAAQQQQVAATLHQLAHQVATNTAIGQQIGATLQQLAQYCVSQVATGHQFAQLLNQLAHQCAWTAQAARSGGIGMQAGFGQPFGYGQQPYAQAWGANRPPW